MDKQAEIKPTVYVRFVNEAEGELDGYLAVWGSPTQRDEYKTWFDPAKPPDLGLKDGEFLPVRLLLEHGFDGDAGKTIIGKIVQVWRDNVGIRFRAYLDKAGALFKRVVEDIRAGKLGVSSASAEHLADFDDEGRFVNWYLSEVSLTESPAEPRMPKVALVRSAPNSTQLVFSNDKPAGTGGDPIGGGAPFAADRGVTEGASAVQPKPISQPTRSKRGMLTLEQLGVAPGASIDEVWKALVAMVGPAAAAAMLDEITGEQPADDAGAVDPNAAPPAMMSAESARAKKAAPVKPAPVADDVATIRAEFEAFKKAQMAAPPADELPVVRTGAQISGVRSMKYDTTTLNGLTWAANVLQSINRPVSAEFVRALCYKAAQDQESGDKAANDYHVRMASPFRSTKEVMESKFTAYRANEVDNTAATAKGIEWVGTKYETDLWLTVRQATMWQELTARGMLVKDVPRGFSSDIIPIEGADLTCYTTAETTTIDSTNRPNVSVTLSNVGTGKATVTVKKLTAAAAYSGEFDEDSLISAGDEFDRKMRVQAQEQIEYALINGDTDTSASTNINKIDGTPGGTENYILGNGMLKLALVTNTANARDGGALDKLDYRILLGYLGTNGVAGNDPDKLLFVTDIPTYLTTLDLPEVLTKEVSSFVTIENGKLNQIYGVKLFRSGQMGLANTSGKISVTAGNNTKGRILLVRPDQWALAFKRQITTEVQRYPMSDATVVVTGFRLGWIYRNSDTASAVSYNLTTV